MRQNAGEGGEDDPSRDRTKAAPIGPLTGWVPPPLYPDLTARSGFPLPLPLSLLSSCHLNYLFIMIARGVDVISMLVAIYGSPDVFVEQYQTLLSTRLLKQTQYFIDKEVIAIYIQINTKINKITSIVSLFI